MINELTVNPWNGKCGCFKDTSVIFRQKDDIADILTSRSSLQRPFKFPTPVSDQADMEDATHALTGLSSWSVWALTNSAADALVLTGGGLGGCRWVVGRAGAAGEVRLTYSDRSVSNWGTQEPTNQTREQPESSTVMRWKQKKQQLHGEWTRTHTMTSRGNMEATAQQCLHFTEILKLAQRFKYFTGIWSNDTLKRLQNQNHILNHTCIHNQDYLLW